MIHRNKKLSPDDLSDKCNCMSYLEVTFKFDELELCQVQLNQILQVPLHHKYGLLK